MTRSHGDVPSVLRGRIYGADIDKIYTDEITRDYGALPVATLRRVDDALHAALNL